jgi:hypothetical protein
MLALGGRAAEARTPMATTLRLIARCDTTLDDSTRAVALDSLRALDDPGVRRAIARGLTREASDRNWWRALFLARHGDRAALAVLDDHYGEWAVSSVELAAAARQFGRWRYTPAIPNLIESLDAASLNLAGEALESLRRMFPGSPRDFASPAAATAYFESRRRHAR